MSLAERGGKRVYLSYLSRWAWIGKGDACTRTLHGVGVRAWRPCFVNLGVASFWRACNTTALISIQGKTRDATPSFEVGKVSKEKVSARSRNKVLMSPHVFYTRQAYLPSFPLVTSAPHPRAPPSAETIGSLAHQIRSSTIGAKLFPPVFPPRSHFPNTIQNMIK